MSESNTLSDPIRDEILRMIRDEIVAFDPIRNGEAISLRARSEGNYLGVSPGTRDVNTGNPPSQPRQQALQDEAFEIRHH